MSDYIVTATVRMLVVPHVGGLRIDPAELAAKWLRAGALDDNSQVDVSFVHEDGLMGKDVEVVSVETTK